MAGQQHAGVLETRGRASACIDMIVNLAAAGFFAYLLGPRLIGLVETIQAGRGDGGRISYYLDTAIEMLTVVFITLVVSLFLLRRPAAGRHGSTVMGLLVLAGTLAFCLPMPQGENMAAGRYLVYGVSRALLFSGMLFSIISLACLGRCFGIRPVPRGLVTRGPYRWVRHPLYLGELLFWLGSVIARPSPAFICLFFLLCGLQYWRALLEEKVLAEAFPEYEQYRRKTYRIIPLVH